MVISTFVFLALSLFSAYLLSTSSAVSLGLSGSFLNWAANACASWLGFAWANEVMESYRDKCIDEVLDKIKDIAPRYCNSGSVTVQTWL